VAVSCSELGFSAKGSAVEIGNRDVSLRPGSIARRSYDDLQDFLKNFQAVHSHLDPVCGIGDLPVIRGNG
jgi:hypothetical protein